MDFDPLGTLGLASNGTNFYTSADKGNTWSVGVAVPTSGTNLGLGNGCCITSPSPGQFLAGAITSDFSGNFRKGQIMASDDSGVTWVDKTGNLYDLEANDPVAGVANQGLRCTQIECFYF